MVARAFVTFVLHDLGECSLLWFHTELGDVAFLPAHEEGIFPTQQDKSVLKDLGFVQISIFDLGNECLLPDVKHS